MRNIINLLTKPQLDDEEHNEIRKRITDIHTLGEILDDQMELGNWEWLERVVPKLRSATQLAQEVRQHEGRRTMAITNGSRSDRRALPTALIGYKHRAPSSNLR